LFSFPAWFFDYENVGPTVVVVIKEPGGEAEEWFGNAGCGGDVGEVPGEFGRPPPHPRLRRGFGGQAGPLPRWGGGRRRGGLAPVPRALVSVKGVAAAAAGEVEIGQAIAVVVGAGYGFDEGEVRDAGFAGAFGEGAVAVVAIKFARMK